ncbi:hypothetical protein [Chryseobacterium terrae]|uniref:Uncharacterized protein n=1 Tax=Chryseobacterium terrae TaxID=3163299 RepID=A0ABW8Y835_9FLAO
MKKIIFASALSLGLLLPAITKAAESPTTTTSELSVVQKKKKKSKNRKSVSKKKSSRGCTYNGHALTLGPRGGCYYYSGNSKEYVDRSYCASCN